MSFSASAYDNYNKPFVFLENGIEFAVFKDGQFDFNILNPVRNGYVNISTRNINFSFNTGHNYDAFVQYDHYGAVVQIENTTIDYNHFGRVRRIGNVLLYYNHIGLVSGIGNLHIAYNNGYVAHCSGYVNNYNIDYAFRPHHRYYRVPSANKCIVYNRPYRRNYTPNRCDYVVYRRNYHNNYYNRSYANRNYYHPGDRITTRTVITAPRRYYNNREVATPRKKIAMRDTPSRKVYTSRSTTRTYKPRRTYSSQNSTRTYSNNRSNSYTKANTTIKYVDRSYRSTSNTKANISRNYSNRKVAATTNTGRSYRRR